MLNTEVDKLILFIYLPLKSIWRLLIKKKLKNKFKIKAMGLAKPTE